MSESRSALEQPKNYSGFIALAALLLFLTVVAVAGLTNEPLEGKPVPTMRPHPVDISFRVFPENCELSNSAPGVKIESNVGTCRLTIQREPNPFVVVRTKASTDYNRTASLNSVNVLIIDLKDEAVVVLNDLPRPEFDRWPCGFDAVPGSISDDTCGGTPLPVSYN